jgi:hypothetical protein
MILNSAELKPSFMLSESLTAWKTIWYYLSETDGSVSWLEMMKVATVVWVEPVPTLLGQACCKLRKLSCKLSFVTELSPTLISPYFVGPRL